MLNSRSIFYIFHFFPTISCRSPCVTVRLDCLDTQWNIIYFGGVNNFTLWKADKNTVNWWLPMGELSPVEWGSQEINLIMQKGDNLWSVLFACLLSFFFSFLVASPVIVSPSSKYFLIAFLKVVLVHCNRAHRLLVRIPFVFFPPFHLSATASFYICFPESFFITGKPALAAHFSFFQAGS